MKLREAEHRGRRVTWRFTPSTSGLQGPAGTHGPLPGREACPPRPGGSRGPSPPPTPEGKQLLRRCPSAAVSWPAGRPLCGPVALPFLTGTPVLSGQEAPLPINHLPNGPLSKCSHTGVHPGLRHVNLGGAECRLEPAVRSRAHQHRHHHGTQAGKPSTGSQNTCLRPSQVPAAGPEGAAEWQSGR